MGGELVMEVAYPHYLNPVASPPHPPTMTLTLHPADQGNKEMNTTSPVPIAHGIIAMETNHRPAVSGGSCQPQERETDKMVKALASGAQEGRI